MCKGRNQRLHCVDMHFSRTPIPFSSLPKVVYDNVLRKTGFSHKASPTPHLLAPKTVVVYFSSCFLFSIFLSFVPSPFLLFSPSFLLLKMSAILLLYFWRFPSVTWSTFPVPPTLLGAPVMPY